MKRMSQFRYGLNSTVTADKLKTGNIFENFSQISALGIQGEPGTMFILNGSDYPITLGETGIYEIDLEDRGFIHSISFLDSSDINSPFKKYQKGSQLLIDIIYEGTVNN